MSVNNINMIDIKPSTCYLVKEKEPIPTEEEVVAEAEVELPVEPTAEELVTVAEAAIAEVVIEEEEATPAP